MQKNGRVWFSQIGDLYHFTGLIFVDVHNHAHYTLYNRAYFVGLTFAVSQSSMKIAKIGPLENFPLYSRCQKQDHFVHKMLKFWQATMTQRYQPSTLESRALGFVLGESVAIFLPEMMGDPNWGTNFQLHTILAIVMDIHYIGSGHGTKLCNSSTIHLKIISQVSRV